MTVVQWYPGHMVKAQNKIRDELKLIDVVIELVDARIPVSSRNPQIAGIIGKKPQIMILNRSDQADAASNRLWLNYFEAQSIPAGLVDSHSGEGIKAVSGLVRQAYQENKARLGAQKIKTELRSLIIGIPNVGKSTFINRLVGKNLAKVGNKAGVTRGNQWLRVDKTLELLDTPGILWPKFEDQDVGFKLAVTGAINDNILDFEDIAYKLLHWYWQEGYLVQLQQAYQLQLPEEPVAATHIFAEDNLAVNNADNLTGNGEYMEAIMAEVAKRRGCLLSGGRIDTLKTAQLLVKDFRAGKHGRITMELPPQLGAANE